MQPLSACLLTIALFLTTPFAALAQSHPWIPGEWQSRNYVSHGLVGTLFTGTGRPTSTARLLKQARLTKFILLGEAHDNPDHHQIQAAIIDALADKDHRPSVVFEQVPQRLASEVTRYDLKIDPNLENFGRRLEWEDRGWYEWKIYQPIAMAAAQNQLAMFAGNLDRELTRAISKSGLKALTGEQVESFALDKPLPPVNAKELTEELEQSHCGMMPERALPAMTNVQRARDGSMAQAMIKADQGFGSILIAGNGHVRKDRAVPHVLYQLLPGGRVISLGKMTSSTGQEQDIMVKVLNSHNLVLGLIEVDDERPNFEDYALQSSDGTPLYDFVLFTPKFDLTDHCAALREKFRKPKKSQP